MRAALFVVITTLALLWPAWFNGYPLMFGDTGVYLTDGTTLHVSWPRPFFYGLAMLPLHLKLSAWPVVVAQAAGAAALLRMTLVMFLPRTGEALCYGVASVLAVATSLPWFASQMMPDVFGPLIILALAPVILMPERFAPWLQLLLVLVSAAFISFHQSYVPIAGAAVVILLALRWWRGGGVGWPDLARGFAAPLLAVLVTIAANALFLGHASFSPYGKIFPLARMILEGPGLRTLQRECPQPGWTLCSQLGHLPDNFENFLFGPGGTVSRAGGAASVAAQAGPIIADTFKAEPGAIVRAAIARSAAQFVSFATGDWLLKPKPLLAEDWARTFPPAEVARFAAARQQRVLPLVSDDLQMLHRSVGFASLGLLFIGIALERRSALGALLVATAVALVVNAVTTGGLSGVYDRYQSRFIWLAVLGSLMWLASAWQRARHPRQAAGGAATA